MPKAISYRRFSSTQQARGDSLRRQTEAAEAYCRAHGDELDLDFVDAGMSAYRGKNATEGALKRFVELAEAGTFEPGTKLVVEHLDRLSRSDILTAQAQFHRILKAGLTIVTLADGQTYTLERLSNDIGALIISIVLMFKANEESKLKGSRVSKAKAARRERMREDTGIKLTRRCPEWFIARGVGERIKFEPIPSRVAVVNRVFEEAVAGLGKRKIAARLNQEGIPAFRGSAGWHHSSVAKIIANDAVIGRFHPHVLKDGKRTPAGAPVEHYFPGIVDEGVFWRAQAAVEGRRHRAAGRKGEGYSNLLSGLGRCKFCHGTLIFVNKGPRPKGGQYLACAGALRGLCSNRIHHPYPPLEQVLLAALSIQPDVGRLLDAPDPVVDRAMALEAEIANKSATVERLFLEFGSSSSPAAVKRIRQLEEEVAELQKRLEGNRRSSLMYQANRDRDFHAEFVELAEKMQRGEVDPGVRFLLRARVAQALKHLIDELVADDRSVTAWLHRAANGRRVGVRITGGATQATIEPLDDTAKTVLLDLERWAASVAGQ